MIQYLCDRCKALLSDPHDSLRSTLFDSEIAKRGVSVRLPTKVTIQDKAQGFRMDIVHFCPGCLEDLAVWRTIPKGS